MIGETKEYPFVVLCFMILIIWAIPEKLITRSAKKNNTFTL
jgi:hypothetical protein